MTRMMKFSVPDMSCGHCKAAVERAITAQDAQARVVVDLSTRTVAVDTAAPAETLLKALAQEGYPATPV